MLIYALTVILMAPPASPLAVFTEWLRQKTGDESVSIESLLRPTSQTPPGLRTADGGRRLRDRQRHTHLGSQITVECDGALTDPNFIWAGRFSHGDSAVKGRQWNTEVGIRRGYIEQAGGKREPMTQYSVVLQTSEISVKVTEPVTPSVPGFVAPTLERGLPLAGTPGLRVVTLDDLRDAEAFGYDLEENQTRSHPIILIAPLEGRYLIDPEGLRAMVAGMAEVVCIPPALMGEQRLVRLIGQAHTPYPGAAMLIYPPRRDRTDPDRIFAYSQPFPAALLMERAQSGKRQAAEREIFVACAHAMNIPNSRRHFSPEAAKEALQRRELAALRAALSANAQADSGTREYLALLESHSTSLEAQVTSLTAQNEALELKLMEADDTSRRLRHEADALKLSLQFTPSAVAPVLPEAVALALRAASRAFTPVESLRLLAELFPDRLRVLDRAYESAAESVSFRYRAKLFDMLWTLVTDYYTALFDGGGGDTEARKVFGINAYSANESESVRGNRRARALRTFDVDGVATFMEKHLKIGTNPGPDEAIRVHFDVYPDRRQIVIGYCGKHLDNK